MPDSFEFSATSSDVLEMPSIDCCSLRLTPDEAVHSVHPTMSQTSYSLVEENVDLLDLDDVLDARPLTKITATKKPLNGR